jgi:RimJ/RimL family protein N-acetyltransferase
MNLQPTLKGKLLTLRPLKQEDFEALCKVASDPLIWEQHPEKNRSERPIFEKFFQKGVESQGALIAVDNKTGEIIGTSRYHDFIPANKTVEIGYTFLAKRCWGIGFNSEMKQLMLSHAFQFVNEVFFLVGEDNKRSRLAVEKLGARLVDKFERQPPFSEKYIVVRYLLKKNS